MVQYAYNLIYDRELGSHPRHKQYYMLETDGLQSDNRNHLLLYTLK